MKGHIGVDDQVAVRIRGLRQQHGRVVGRVVAHAAPGSCAGDIIPHVVLTHNLDHLPSARAFVEHTDAPHRAQLATANSRPAAKQWHK